MPDRMCNRIQGRTPVFGSCLFWSSDVCWMLSVVCYWNSIWCFWCGPNGHVVRLSFVRFWFLRWSWVVVCGCGLSQFCGIWDGPWFVEIHQILVSEVDLLFFVTLFGICQRCVSEVDLAGVVVRTFCCWSDFSMRASVKHELLGHGFHDELFN